MAKFTIRTESTTVRKYEISADTLGEARSRLRDLIEDGIGHEYCTDVDEPYGEEVVCR